MADKKKQPSAKDGATQKISKEELQALIKKAEDDEKAEAATKKPAPKKK